RCGFAIWDRDEGGERCTHTPRELPVIARFSCGHLPWPAGHGSGSTGDTTGVGAESRIAAGAGRQAAEPSGAASPTARSARHYLFANRIDPGRAETHPPERLPRGARSSRGVLFGAWRLSSASE